LIGGEAQHIRFIIGNAGSSDDKKERRDEHADPRSKNTHRHLSSL
jgi:hypothetical protein